MNRFFDFSRSQVIVVLALAAMFLCLSIYRLTRRYADTGESALRLSVQVGDNDTRYNPVFKVDLNHSPSDSLELIPGIGPVLAGRIVAYRDSAGHFQTVDEVTRVRGIHARLFERIKPYLLAGEW